VKTVRGNSQIFAEIPVNLVHLTAMKNGRKPIAKHSVFSKEPGIQPKRLGL
jgi:hypothetical protein